jgi:hypothetical protein
VDGSFPNVTSVVDEFVSHLHLRVLHPKTDVLELYLKSSFIDGPRSAKFVELFFKASVSNPDAHVVALSTYSILELLAFAVLEFAQFIFVHDALVRRSHFLLLMDLGVLDNRNHCVTLSSCSAVI